MEREYNVNVRDIMISDPCILTVPETGKYYVYARFFNPKVFKDYEFGNNFYALESPDLENWSQPIKVFEKGDDFWADLDYWAPECHFYNGKYYLLSTFRAAGTYRRCQALVADSPLGPFKPIEAEPVTPPCWNCLDGTLYIDLNSKPWMVFCHEWVQVYDGQVCAIPLSDDLGHAAGDPIILFRASDAPWYDRQDPNRFKSGLVTDGPFMHRLQNGNLIMLWSGFSAGKYTTAIARSVSGEIYGPWVQDSEPVYSLDAGHSSLFRALDGRLMMAMHCFNREHINKRMLIFEVTEFKDKLQIVNEITGNWFNALERYGNSNRRQPDLCEKVVLSPLSTTKLPIRKPV